MRVRQFATPPLVPLLLTLWLGPVLAESVTDVPNPRVRDSTWVTDLPAALRPDTVQRLNRLIDELERDTTAEMAVVVIHSLDGESIETFANQLFNLWGIGKRESDNGVLLLWATTDRQLRIEVGTGLESLIPDSRAGAVLDSQVVPRFREGDFDGGVVTGMETLASLVRGGGAETPQDAVRSYTPVENPVPGEGGAEGSGLWNIWGAVIGLLGAGGGVAGFRRWRRYRKRSCPSCNTQMTLLDETADDAHLDKPGQLEERLGSVDYDVWQCRSCGHSFTLRYPKWFTSYGSCPQCSHRTCSKSEQVVEAATTSSSGRARVTEDCEFCTYQRVYTRTIPRKSSSSSSSGSSSFGGGSSSGGGASRGY